MKYLKILPLLLLPLFAAAQPLGTWPVQYGDTPPTHTPSGSGTRIYLNISTNDLYNWNPAPVSSWVKYPKGFDQISGCAAPGYTPTARQSVFAVNSCTALQNGRGPELYQYTGSQWICLNCYPAYTAGTGIGISSGVITNTAPDQVVSISGVGITPSGTYPNFTLTAADQSSTNELQNLSLSGQSLGISSGTGVTLPVVGVSAGTGIGVSGSSGTFTVSNTGDLSATNELNTSFSVSGSNLALTDAGGTINVAVSSIAPVQAVTAGTGISISGTTTRTVTNTGDLSATNEIQTLSLSGSDLSLSLGGGTVTLPGGADGNGIYSGDGTIPGAVATLAEDVIFSINYFNGNPGIRVNDEENRLELYSENNLSAFVFTNDLASVYSPTAVLSLEATGNVFSDLAVTPVGIQYAAEYPDILTNDRSIPDVGLTKQLISSENGALGTGFTGGGGSGTIPPGTYAQNGANSLVFLSENLDLTDFIGFRQDEINYVGTGYNQASDGSFAYIADIGDGTTGTRYLIDKYGTIMSSSDGVSSSDVSFLASGPIFNAQVSTFLGGVQVGQFTNAAAPNNTIFYSTTDSKLSYKDPGGTVHGLY